MTAILGISAFYHDSAAALVVDGEIMAAAQEERFTRKKHDPEFPAQAIAYCLAEAGLDASQLDYVTFYDKPFTKFDRLLETYLSYAPAGLRSFSLAMPLWLKQKLHLRRIIRTHLDGCRAPLLFMDHHESHAASAFFPSPFDEAAILTLDGVGEWSTTTFGVGTGNQLQLTHHVSFPHSLGLLYSAFTYYCGFKVNSGEYKLMGLAPYGRPVYADAIREHLIDIKPDGSFWLNMDYFNYCQGLTMTGPRFHLLFGGAPRAPESPIEPRHMDLALLVGYFEGIDSERGIAWRAADSLAIRRFLGIAVDEDVPDHSTISRTRRLIDVETHRAVFTWVQQRLVASGVLKGATIGIDATTLEANAAMRSIVRRDTGEDYQAYLTGLAQASGIATPTRDDLARLDRKRKKTTSNKDWRSPVDPDAKVAKMKDHRTHLAHKVEHAVDLDTGAVVAVTVQGADTGDTTTIGDTTVAAADQIEDAQAEVDDPQAFTALVADKGYHSNEVMVDLQAVGVRSYVAEPDRGRRDWRRAFKRSPKT